MTAYETLEKHFAQMNALQGSMSMLGWDAAVMMPEGSSSVRSEQLAALAEVVHEKITAPQIKDLLDQAESERSTLSAWQQANLREMRHSWIHENAVPTDLVSAYTKACNDTEVIWRTARKENDFKLFATHFTPLLSLLRDIAAAKASALGCSLYDAMLDGYDPGTRTAMIDPLFSDLETFLPPLLEEVLEHQAKTKPAAPVSGSFAIEKQNALGLAFMRELGFNFNEGRLDISTHPFCGGVPGDVRLTTRYKEDSFTESFFGVMHETGHALYEMGLPSEWRTQPVGRARGMSMHESQSLIIEMQLSLHPDFLANALPRMQDVLGGESRKWTVADIIQITTHVERSLIRVTADEVTYPLHVMLRYRLEKAMLNGDLQVDDLPSAWNEKMKHYLGITPKNDSEGCLQDIHWAGGSIGYFPTYTLGAITAAQLFDAARSQIPDFSESIKRGQYNVLTHWLREHIHAKASFLPMQDLLVQATGKPLDVSVYKAHLKNRYLA